MMSAQARRAFGEAARTIVSRVLAQEDQPAPRVALETLVLTIDTDPAASEALLSRILAPDRVAAWGYAEVLPSPKGPRN